MKVAVFQTRLLASHHFQGHGSSVAGLDNKGFAKSKAWNYIDFLIKVLAFLSWVEIRRVFNVFQIELGIISLGFLKKFSRITSLLWEIEDQDIQDFD